MENYTGHERICTFLEVLVFVCLTEMSLLSAFDIGINFSPWQ